jgi:hypothetical protein
MGNTAMGLALKSPFIATAILVSASIAPAQTAAPAKHLLEVVQILSYKQSGPSTFDLTLRLEDGATIELRMNTFVAQDLSRQLGNFNRDRHHP